ncbi:MAG: hypothetical protein IJK17_04645 [Lachnospiraceae bacterium]|nr:hypothetical protein [Lachnospiraceae bacterium]
MKKAAKIIGIILAVLVAIPLVLLLIVSIRTALTQDDYSAVYTDPKYQNPVKVADVEELLERTSFWAYEHMPLFMRMGFAIGLFEKNTLYSVE